MKLTVLFQGRTPEDQIGYHSAFMQLKNKGVLSEYTPIPYRNIQNESDSVAFWNIVYEHVRSASPDVLLCQFFHYPFISGTKGALERIRALPNRPTIVTSCGDGLGAWLSPPQTSLLEAAALSDLTFASSMGRLADVLARAGARRITLMPLAACDITFPALPAPTASARAFDVVFVGSVVGRNPARRHFWISRQRKAMVDELHHRFGRRFGLFGRGWEGHPAWRGPVAFQDQASVYRESHVVWGGVPGSSCDYYASDRPFIAMTTGVPLVEGLTPRLDEILEPGVDCLLERGRSKTLAAVEFMLENSTIADQIAAAALVAVEDRHRTSHRVRDLVSISISVHQALRSGLRPEVPSLSFLRNSQSLQLPDSGPFRCW